MTESDGASAGERQGEHGRERGEAGAGKSRPAPALGRRRGRDLPAPASMMEGGGHIREVLTGCPFPNRSRERSWKGRCPAAASPAWSFGRSRRCLPLPNRPFRKRKAGNSTRPAPPRAPAGLSAATASAQVPQRFPSPGSTVCPHGHRRGSAVIPAAASLCARMSNALYP